MFAELADLQMLANGTGKVKEKMKTFSRRKDVLMEQLKEKKVNLQMIFFKGMIAMQYHL